MDMVLIVLGVLGLGAIVISAYVFAVAARNYVSAEQMQQRAHHRNAAAGKRWATRSGTDRRSGAVVQFPLEIDGQVIPEDRRKGADRRLAA